MWFKNLQIFQIDEAIAFEPENLSAQLEESRFVPCSKASASSIGFYPPMGHPEAQLVHGASGFMMFCLKIQEKVIPPSLIKEMLQDAVREIEEEENRRVSYKEKSRLKEDILSELMLHAYCKTQYLHAYIDTRHQLLIVNAGSASKAEVFINSLRAALGSLKVSLPKVTSPSLFMTEWLKNQEASDDFIIDDFCELRDVDDLGKIRAVSQDILSENIQNFLNDGCVVKQLRLEWHEQIKFVLKEDFSFNGIKYLDKVLDQRDDSNTETAELRFDADFTIMTQSLAQLIEKLMTIFAQAKAVA